MRLSRMVEALLFASEAPLGPADLARVDDSLDEEQVERIVAELKAEYEATERAFGIFEIAGGFQILTLPEYGPVLERFETVPSTARLSAAALETLAIIAYRQPVGRAEIEDIRGVGVGSVLKTLLERNLAEVVGRGEGLGRPLLYGTTRQFLEHFGFRGLDELPRSEELSVILATRDRPAGDGDADSAAGGGRPDDRAMSGPDVERPSAVDPDWIRIAAEGSAPEAAFVKSNGGEGDSASGAVDETVSTGSGDSNAEDVPSPPSAPDADDSVSSPS